MPTATVRSLAVLALVAAARTSEGQIPDHLKCFKIKDSVKVVGTADLDTPQFGADPGCKVSKAKLFCVPATKTNVAVTDKTTGTPITPLPVTAAQPGDRLCYKVKCPTAASIADQSVTDQFGNRTASKLKASLVCTPAFKGSARYVDNGDGTVTDNYTGLQWEKKVSPGGGATDPHDVNNTYSWSFTGAVANGTAYLDFLNRLNTCTSADGTTMTASFAGHCDWRLPTIAELRTILRAPFPCAPSPCIDPVFGPTLATGYWSSTTDASDPAEAWGVSFIDGLVFGGGDKPVAIPVRAVRGLGG